MLGSFPSCGRQKKKRGRPAVSAWATHPSSYPHLQLGEKDRKKPGRTEQRENLRSLSLSGSGEGTPIVIWRGHFLQSSSWHTLGGTQHSVHVDRPCPELAVSLFVAAPPQILATSLRHPKRRSFLMIPSRRGMGREKPSLPFRP